MNTSGHCSELSIVPLPHSRARGGSWCAAANGRPAFTLLELVLVMVLITIVMALASADLRNFFQGSRLKNAATQLIALTEWCRTQAVTDGRVYRLNCNADGYWVTVQDLEQFGGQFVKPRQSDFGQEFSVSDENRLTLTRGDGQGGDHVDFFPDGRTEPAEFLLERQDGRDSVRIISPSPTERFHVAAQNEVLTRQ